MRAYNSNGIRVVTSDQIAFSAKDVVYIEALNNATTVRLKNGTVITLAMEMDDARRLIWPNDWAGATDDE